MDISKHRIREWSVVKVVRQLFSSSTIILLPGTTVSATRPGFSLDIKILGTSQMCNFPSDNSQMCNFPSGNFPNGLIS